MSWLKLTLGSKEFSEGIHTDVQNTFEKLFISTGGPTGVGMFSDKEWSTEDSKCIYLTPSDHNIVQLTQRKHQFSLCDPPSLDNIKLLVGASDIKSILASS